MKLSNDEKNQIFSNAQERIKKLHPEIVTNQLLDFYKSAIDMHKIKYKTS